MEAEVETLTRDADVAGEAVHDPADVADSRRAEEVQDVDVRDRRVVVRGDPGRTTRRRVRAGPRRAATRLTTVNDHRLLHPARHAEQVLEDPELLVTGRQVAEVIEADLTHCDDPRRRGEPLDLVEHLDVRRRGIVGMHADRRPHVPLAGRERDRGAGRLDVGADGQHRGDPGLSRAVQHGDEIVREVREVQMRVRVEEVRHGRTGRVTASPWTSRGTGVAR